MIWIILIKLLVPLHPLSNITITRYSNYKPRFNGVYSRDNLPRTKDGVYVKNLDVKQSKRTHSVSLFVDITYLGYNLMILSFIVSLS